MCLKPVQAPCTIEKAILSRNQYLYYGDGVERGWEMRDWNRLTEIVREGTSRVSASVGLIEG